MKYAIVEWDEVKEDNQYPEEDNNNGFIHGVYWLDRDENVVDVTWYKTEDERDNDITAMERLSKRMRSIT